MEAAQPEVAADVQEQPEAEQPEATAGPEPETEAEAEAEAEAEVLDPAAVVRSGLSHLGVTANGLSHAYLSLRLTGEAAGQALGEAAGAVANYPHLQDVALPCCGLSSLSALSALPYLTRVDASANTLTEALSDVRPPPRNLTAADLSRNAIGDAGLAGLAAHRHLRSLDLSHNRLTAVTALAALQALEEVRLDGNELTSLAGLEGLPLRVVHAAGNAVASLAPLERCAATLRALDVSNNAVASLAPLSCCARLGSLNVARNALATLEEVRALWALPLLHVLDIRNNAALEAVEALRLHVLHILPRLTALDGQGVSAKEKVHAANLHGADAAAVATIRDRYFPAGMKVGDRAVKEAVKGADNVGTAITPTDPVRVATRRASLAATPRESAAGNAYTAVMLASSLAELAAALCGGPLNPNDDDVGRAARARALFDWVMRNGDNLPSYFVMDPESTYPRALSSLQAATDGSEAARRACAHAAAFGTLARCAGLESAAFAGFLKGPNFLPGDAKAVPQAAWNAVRLSPDGAWKLLDCALAAAAAAGGGSAEWHFLRDADEFVYDHYPVAEALGDARAVAEAQAAISASQFWSLPQCTAAFFECGLQLLSSAAAVLERQRDSPLLLVSVLAPEGAELRAEVAAASDPERPLGGDAARVQREVSGAWSLRLCLPPAPGGHYVRVAVRDAERLGVAERWATALTFKVAEQRVAAE